MRLIDGEKLIEDLRRYKHEVISVDGLEGIISLMPSAEPKRKTGRWIKTHMGIFEDEDSDVGYECTNCHVAFFSSEDWPYCPLCGSYNGGERDGNVNP